jgi:hypothetical protein
VVGQVPLEVAALQAAKWQNREVLLDGSKEVPLDRNNDVTGLIKAKPQP